MPARNIVKPYISHAFYHVYNRGASRQTIFRDEDDYRYFLSLLREWVRSDCEKGDVTLQVIAYCLMSNHFHLVLRQLDDEHAMTRLIHAVCTKYSMYFNRKYKHSGHVFQSIYRAKHIDEERYLLHSTRYVHLNPLRSYVFYEWSSYREYVGLEAPSDIIDTSYIMDIYGTKEEYAGFVASYVYDAVAHQIQKRELDELYID